MSDNQDSIGNAWRFRGTIIAVIKKVTKKDKAFAEIVASRQDGQYTRLCVCTAWGVLESDIVAGADVTLCGRLHGREYNGRHYAGLTALDIQVHGVEMPAEPETATDIGTDGQAAETTESQEALPF